MKRLALLLGSLLVVTAAASAKEVVPAPVVVEEAPVQIVEKEVIVYRDKEEGFRPNGSVDVQYRYYGNAEGDTARDAKWATNNNSSRTQITAKINMTEKQTLEARIRDYNSLDQASTYTYDIDDTPSVVAGSTQTRLRYWYNHGLLGDSKVDLDSRVEYINEGASQYVEYQAQFNFAEYLFNNDFVKTDNFQVAPKYRYTWNDDNSSHYNNQVGVDLYSFYTLPAGFSAELNVYATQTFYGNAAEKTDNVDKTKKYDDNFNVYVEAYLYNTTNLYTNGNYAVDFVFEGGLDGYNWSQEKILLQGDAATPTTSDSTYSLYAYPAVRLSYQATDFVNVYALAGAEYRNYVTTSSHSAQNWRWQPTATVGFTTTF